MLPYLRLFLPMVLLAALGGCGPDYSPNTYSSAAVQQANKVDQGIIAGFREVKIRADGTVGAVTGGAAGGVLGAQEPDGGVVTALSAIGGTLVGGIIGAGVEHATDDTTAFEYLVRKTNGDLLSVTQKDTAPLPVGLKVLVIEGKQARVVADYSAPLAPPPSMGKNDKNDGSKSDDKTKAAKADDTSKAVTTGGAPPSATPPNATPTGTAPAPAPAPQPTSTAAQPAAEPADSGPAPQSPAAQAPVPLAPAPPAAQTSPAEAAAPSSPAPQQSAPAEASPPTQSNQSGGDQTGSAPPASDVPAAETPAPAPAPAASKATP